MADGPAADRLYQALAVKLDSIAGLVDSRLRRDLIAEASARLPGLTIGSLDHPAR